MTFPEASYLVLSSRLIPDRDGGYTVATLRRARQMAAAGAALVLLTVDPGTPAAHEAHRTEFVRREELDAPERLRNLFDEASAPHGGAAPWLRAAAHAGEADPSLEYRQVRDAAGRPIVDLPQIDDPDWHLSRAPIVVRGADGESVGVVDGFGALYLAWLDTVVAGVRDRADLPVVLICESRQLGELLAGWENPTLRLIHTVHTTHLEAPYTPDAPVNALWTRWLAVADSFDAVLWPTASQRRDVVERFALTGSHRVVPQAVEAAHSISSARRTRGRVIMLNRLAPGKRVDSAIRAFARVIERVPDATLDIFGQGDERERLQSLIDERGLGDLIRLRGSTVDTAGELRDASVFLSTSAFEGQGLSIAEALAHGCPVVAYDIRYGPREALAAGGGILVPDSDEDALVAALVRVLSDARERERLAAEAIESARRLHPEVVMTSLAEAVRMALDHPGLRLL